MTDDTGSMRARQAAAAIAAHLAAGDEPAARELAGGMSHPDLVNLAVWMGRIYGGGLLDAIQRQGYPEPEARQMTARQLRTEAQAASLLGEDQ